MCEREAREKRRESERETREERETRGKKTREERERERDLQNMLTLKNIRHLIAITFFVFSKHSLIRYRMLYGRGQTKTKVIATTIVFVF